MQKHYHQHSAEISAPSWVLGSEKKPSALSPNPLLVAPAMAFIHVHLPPVKVWVAALALVQALSWRCAIDDLVSRPLPLLIFCATAAPQMDYATVLSQRAGVGIEALAVQGLDLRAVPVKELAVGAVAPPRLHLGAINSRVVVWSMDIQALPVLAILEFCRAALSRCTPRRLLELPLATDGQVRLVRVGRVGAEHPALLAAAAGIEVAPDAALVSASLVLVAGDGELDVDSPEVSVRPDMVYQPTDLLRGDLSPEGLQLLVDLVIDPRQRERAGSPQDVCNDGSTGLKIVFEVDFVSPQHPVVLALHLVAHAALVTLVFRILTKSRLNATNLSPKPLRSIPDVCPIHLLSLPVILGNPRISIRVRCAMDD